jgi:hypothetical protein
MAITIDGSNGIANVDGSAAAPSLTGADADTGVFTPAANTVAISTDGTERVRVDSTGQVGIGTSSPSAALDVVGEAIVGNGTDGVKLSWSTGSSAGVIDTADTSDTLSIRTSGTERMRIDSSGRLLIGKTSVGYQNPGLQMSPSGALEVTRNSNYPFIFRRNGTIGTIGYFNYNGVDVGTISTNGSSTSYNTTSDYRLKEDWQPMSGSIDRVKSLNPVNFAWKVDGSRVDGFLAHEAQEVVPEAVSGTKDAVDAEGNPEYQGIDQSKLTPLLTSALQEAIAKIEDLETRLAAVEGA